MNTNNRFILKPDFYNLGELGLDYKDLLTYITIRSFYNSESKYCYPSFRAIAKLSGLSTYFVGKSMKRLRDAGLLKAWVVAGRRRKAYWYMFENISGLNKVPYELLLNNDLTSSEKSMLILLSEYCKQGFCSDSIAEIADKAGVSQRVIESWYRTLLLKGYIVESMYEDPLTNTLTKHFALTKMLNWNLKPYDIPDDSSDLSIDDLLNIYHNHRRAVTSGRSY